MATQGVVSLVRKGKVFFKVVAGCDGYNAERLADNLKAMKDHTVESIYEMAEACDFGSAECLVVMSETNHLFLGAELSPRYREKFNDPEFNPRWACGIAAYVEVVEI